MKMLSRFLLIAAFLLCAGALYAGDDFCMDCASKTTMRPDGSIQTQAMCCMTTSDNTCFGGYTQVLANVGARCIIREGTNGSTNCGQNTSIDSGCSTGSGGGGGGGGRNDDPGNGCDGSLGACPAWCASCM